MKPLLAIIFLSSFLPCFAQRARPATASNLGNVLHPGTPSPVAVYGNNRGVRRTTGGYTSGYIGSYPLYVGGAYVPAYGTSYAPDYSSQTQLNPQQQYAPAPPVVINQYFGPPAPEPVTGGGIYQPYNDRQPQPEDDSASTPSNKYYLLAFKDHSVYSALAYWVEDKTLHYVTPQNTHNQASLDLVDIDFTKQLNQDRAVPFSITTPSGTNPAK
jgi:hypothetical protein